jgi:hypothetical protein
MTNSTQALDAGESSRGARGRLQTGTSLRFAFTPPPPACVQASANPISIHCRFCCVHPALASQIMTSVLEALQRNNAAGGGRNPPSSSLQPATAATAAVQPAGAAGGEEVPEGVDPEGGLPAGGRP